MVSYASRDVDYAQSLDLPDPASAPISRHHEKSDHRTAILCNPVLKRDLIEEAAAQIKEKMKKMGKKRKNTDTNTTKTLTENKK